MRTKKLESLSQLRRGMKLQVTWAQSSDPEHYLHLTRPHESRPGAWWGTFHGNGTTLTPGREYWTGSVDTTHIILDGGPFGVKR